MKLNQHDIHILKQFAQFANNSLKNHFEFMFFGDLDGRGIDAEFFDENSAELFCILSHDVDIYKEDNVLYKLSKDGSELQWNEELIPLLFHFYGLATMAKFAHNIETDEEEANELF